MKLTHKEQVFNLADGAHPRYHIKQLRKMALLADRKGDVKRLVAAADLMVELNQKHNLGYGVKGEV